MTDKERISKITHLLFDAGAQMQEDFISVSLTINGCGLEFTKVLFGISLGANKNNNLQYHVFRQNMSLISVRSAQSWVEANLEKEIFPVAFWDGIYLMIQRLRKELFPQKCAELSSAWDLLLENHKRHQNSTSMSTLVMSRALRDYIQKKAPHYRKMRRKKNQEKQHIYESLLRLVNTAPHSLNVLRKLNLPLEVKKVGHNNWQISMLDGEFIGWGINPVSTAASLVRQYKEKELQQAVA